MIDCMACLVAINKGAPAAVSTVTRDAVTHGVSNVSWELLGIETCSFSVYSIDGREGGWSTWKAVRVPR